MDHFDAVIVDIGANVEANIYATLAAKDAGARHIVCKAVDVISKRILEKIGADKVIRPEFDSGVELAYALASPKLLGQIDLTNDIIVIELEVSDGLNGSLERLGFAKLGIQVIAHARGQTVRTVINADTEIKRGDKLVRLGRNASLEKLRESVATVRMNERGAGWPSRAIGLPNVPLRSAARIWYSSNVNESALEQSQNCSALEKASSEIAVQCIKSKR